MNWPVRIFRSRNLTRLSISQVKQVRQTSNTDHISIITQGRFHRMSSQTFLLVSPASQNNGHVLFTCTNNKQLHWTSLGMLYNFAIERYFALNLTSVVKHSQWNHKLFMTPLQLLVIIYNCNKLKLTLLYHSTNSYNVS